MDSVLRNGFGLDWSLLTRGVGVALLRVFFDDETDVELFKTVLVPLVEFFEFQPDRITKADSEDEEKGDAQAVGQIESMDSASVKENLGLGDILLPATDSKEYKELWANFEKKVNDRMGIEEDETFISTEYFPFFEIVKKDAKAEVDEEELDRDATGDVTKPFSFDEFTEEDMKEYWEEKLHDFDEHIRVIELFAG